MESTQLIKTLIAQGAPTQSFWESDLEIGCESVLVQVNQKKFMEQGVGHRTGRQIEIIRQNLAMNGEGSTRKKRSQLQPDDPRLLPYLLVQEFAKFKSKGATIDWAQRILPAQAFQSCQKSEDEYDTLALCFAIYHHDYEELRPILHLDKIYKSGFARMKMKNGPRKPKHSFEGFLKPAKVKGILADFDKSKGDGRTSDFKNIIPIDNHTLVFVRRCERPSAILRGTEVVHGYRPEWIVLEFFDAAKRVNISSMSVGDSLAIANLIASDYYGKGCEYENEVEITYPKQIETFLEKLKNDEDPVLPWVELVVGNTPLNGACGMKLTDAESKSIGKAVIHFEDKVGRILSAIDNIESIKVFFREKRVGLLFEKEDDQKKEYVVRYSDHRLTPLERRAFEGHLRTTHGIPVLSTEKRFKDKS